MKPFGKVLCSTAVLVSALAFAPRPASALVPHSCSLSSLTRPQVQACIDDTGYSEAHLTGVANWTLNSSNTNGLVIDHDTPPVFLDANAEINSRYTNTTAGTYNAVVLIQGGSFTMQPGSQITNHHVNGMPVGDDDSQWKRRGVWLRGNGTEDPVQEDGTLTVNGGTIITAGSAVWMARATTSGSQTALIQGGSTVWGFQAIGADPQSGERHDITVVDSTLVGAFYTLSLEPGWSDHGYIKANIHDNALYNPATGWLGYFVVSPGGGAGACNTPIFTSSSGIHNNTGSGKAQVVNSQASLVNNNGYTLYNAC